MKKLAICFVFFILTPSVFADWYYNSKNIVVNIEISSDVEFVPKTSNWYVDSASVNLSFFPKETKTQRLANFHTYPDADSRSNLLRFKWKSPESKAAFKVSTDVETVNTITEVKEKIKFPIEELGEDLAVYTKPSATIDSGSSDIIKTASEIVKGEDDLYAAVFKIADWTKNNINYNLSTLTAEVSQKASWVLQNKQGVCDELTSLFIALLRSVGVPAKFVSGVSYTNSELFSENWGPHGWAEVYFPGHGWIPFDVTYGEFGWVDPTHIKFKESIDSDEPSTYYQWLGRDTDLKTKNLDVKTKLIDKIGSYKVPLNLESNPLKSSVSFGSYNLIEASIENPNDFYYSNELYLSKPKEVKIIGKEARSVLLMPKEKKKVSWIIKVDDNLDRGYSYSFPIVVSTLNNLSSKTIFTSSIRDKSVSFDYASEISKLLEEEKSKKYSGNVLFECKPEKSDFYEYESIMLYCSIKNTGNIFLDDINICFENMCNKFDLGISQTKNIVFDINNSNIGVRDSQVTLRNYLISNIYDVRFKIDDTPKIDIKSLDYPASVSYNENFTVSFAISKKSQSNPKDVEVVFKQNGIEKKWNIDEMSEDRSFVLRFTGRQLKYGENNNEISVTYYDGLKKQYTTAHDFSIFASSSNLIQISILYLNSLASISTEAMAMMLLAGTIAFIIIVLLVFRGNKS